MYERRDEKEIKSLIKSFEKERVHKIIDRVLKSRYLLFRCQFFDDTNFLMLK
jgi:hypothetical protein